MRISDWSSDVCSSDLAQLRGSSDAALRRIGEECQGWLPVFDRSQCIHERQCGVGQFARKPQVAVPICRRGRTSHLPRLFRGPETLPSGRPSLSSWLFSTAPLLTVYRTSVG